MNTGGAAPEPSGPIPIRHVAAVVVGNALEFYDFVTYSFFSLYIGRAFFPSATAAGSLLLSLATFGVGFVMRPVGGIVIGRMGDRRGRRPAMILALMLMGIAITGLALTPSYASIGIAAPILVIVFRLLQGFALGGQVGPATAYMIEAAPPLRRGFYASLQFASQDFAVLVAGLIGLLLANTMDAQQLEDWGWRIALLAGATIVPFGLWLRKNLPETAFVDPSGLAPLAPQDDEAGALANARSRHAEVRAEQRDPRQAQSIRPYARAIALTMAMLGAATIANYTINYLVTYSLDTLRLPATIAFGAPAIAGVCFVLSEPLSGWLSDKFGRKPVMLMPGVLLLIAIWPAFFLLNRYPGALTLYGAGAVLVILLGLCSTPILTSFTETLPKAVRSGTVSIVYAFAIAIFGGSSQFILKWLIETTGDPLAPAYYMTATFAIGLLAMALTKESAPVKVTHQPSP
jgi:MFS transporter, MHS family, citrate/tricarballylate:H+ symporter